jgi:hypothetical protein
MDRSFLSRSEVIEAARPFVCVRLTTYEDREEGAFLKAFNVTRSGELENSVFTILTPDGKRQLARASRSARHTFDDAAHLAATLKRIARAYQGKTAEAGLSELPTVANVRLAVNVAACDNQPLVVLFAPDGPTRRTLEKRLAALAWSDSFRGRFVYVIASTPKDLAAVEGAGTEASVLVVQPDRFGLKGKVLRQVGATAAQDALVSCLREGQAEHRRAARTFAGHVRAGQQLGVFWDTVIPVTDPMERRARERGKRLGPAPR